jgi:riboflavin kinase/FMN adenylyltransferase
MMIVYTSLSKLNLADEPLPKVMCIGMFDGVHVGHRALIDIIKGEAKQIGGMSVVFTFQNHPLGLLAPAYAPPLLTHWRRKIRILETLGVDATVVVPFDENLMSMSPVDFVDGILIGSCDVDLAACGYNFRFGRDGMGSPEELKRLLKERGRKCRILEKVKINDVTVSSTMIRDLIGQRQIDKVRPYLGDWFCLQGRVISGHGRGRTIGFPTANIAEPDGVIVPPRGVYAVRVVSESGVNPGMLNIGRRPTFEVEGEKSIEVHLIDFDGELIDRKIEVAFLAHLRPEQKFDSPEALVEQLKKDRQKVVDIFNRA